MDPVSLALGIAPLCLSGVKGVKIVKKKLRTLRKYGKELANFRKRLRGQVEIFLDECQLLLEEVVDSKTVEAMLDGDATSQHWGSPELEGGLELYLGRKYACVKETIDQICKYIKQLDVELDSLEQGDANDTRIVEAMHRVSDATKVLLAKSKVENLLENLIESVDEFRRLRKVAKAFKKRKRTTVLQVKEMPKVYEKVTRHSSSFYEVLSRTWSCVNPGGTHMRHTAKLLLDVDRDSEMEGREDEHYLKLVFGYEAISDIHRQRFSLFEIRSEDSRWAEPRVSLIRPTGSSEDGNSERSLKIRRVRFTDGSVSFSAKMLPRSSCCPPYPRSLSCSSSNLCQSKDLCSDVFKHMRLPSTLSEHTCIGYFDSTCNLRHRLFLSQDRQSKAIQTFSSSSKPLSSLLQAPLDTHLSVPEQLRLALRLARSVVQFHSTPWWREYWDLSDLSYFDIDTELANSLSTLHIDVNLSGGPNDMNIRGLLEQVPSPPSIDEKILCGIRNVNMHSLGAALLQIGRWETLDLQDIVLLRKKAAQPSHLGPRYDDLISKCLYCDFGFGADLSQPQLLFAVYENVVCELERMVRAHNERARQTWFD